MKQESDQNFLMPVTDRDDVNLNQDDNWISSIGHDLIQSNFFFLFFFTLLFWMSKQFREVVYWVQYLKKASLK